MKRIILAVCAFVAVIIVVLGIAWLGRQIMPPYTETAILPSGDYALSTSVIGAPATLTLGEARFPLSLKWYDRKLPERIAAHSGQTLHLSLQNGWVVKIVTQSGVQIYPDPVAEFPPPRW